MKVVLTAVGYRTEHWTDLFAVLAEQPDLDLTVIVSEVTELTIEGLTRASELSPGLRFHVLPHLIGEGGTGHMASIAVHRKALHALDLPRPDTLHIIGEPAYLSTWQFIGLRNRAWPGVPISHYAAQNVVTRFPFPFPLLERRAYRAIGQMVPITPAAAKVVRAKGYRGESTIVPLGVDTNLFVPSKALHDGDRFTAGFVGRLEKHKGVDQLIEAAERVDCDLMLVGDGGLAELAQCAAERRPGRVTVHPWVDHALLPDLIGRMDVVVLPSVEVIQRNLLPWVGVPLREQFGRVLLEAMACGRPVIGSDVGEIDYVMGDAGLSFPAGDVDALTARLAQLQDDPELAAELGRRGLARARGQFGWDRVARQLLELWRGLVATRGGVVRSEWTI